MVFCIHGWFSPGIGARFGDVLTESEGSKCRASLEKGQYPQISKVIAIQISGGIQIPAKQYCTIEIWMEPGLAAVLET